MSNFVTFQTQLVDIMGLLTQTAVIEISKLVDNSCACLHSEISRERNENEALKRKLQLMESELRTAQRREANTAASISRKERNATTQRDGEPAAVEEEYAALHCAEPYAHIAENGSKSLPVKEERTKENIKSTDPPRGLAITGEGILSTGAEFCADVGEKPSFVELDSDSRASPAEGQEKWNRQTPVECLEKWGPKSTPVEHPKGEHAHSTPVGLEVVVKAEKAEEQLAQAILSETVIGDDEGRFSNLGFSCLRYDGARQRPSPLAPWYGQTEKDPDCSYDTKLNLQMLSVQPVSTPPEGSGPSNVGSLDEGPQIDVLGIPYAKEAEILSVCGEDFRSAIDHTQRAACGDRLGPEELEDITSLSRQTQHPHPQHKLVYNPTENTFKMAKKIKAYRKVGTEEKRFHSTECEKTFGGFVHLKVHHQSHTGEMPYSCVQCGKTFLTRGSLIKHAAVHSDKKPFSCSQCGKGFTLQGNLKAHQRIHTGERPFCCAQCGKCFARFSHLKRHVQSHTGVKPYSCVECGKSFTRQVNLIQHQRIHTGERPFSCALCGKNFSRSSCLKTHELIHSGVRPFRCAQCGKSFIQQVNLKTHERVHCKK